MSNVIGFKEVRNQEYETLFARHSEEFIRKQLWLHLGGRKQAWRVKGERGRETGEEIKGGSQQEEGEVPAGRGLPSQQPPGPTDVILARKFPSQHLALLLCSGKQLVPLLFFDLQSLCLK